MFLSPSRDSFLSLDYSKETETGSQNKPNVRKTSQIIIHRQKAKKSLFLGEKTCDKRFLLPIIKFFHFFVEIGVYSVV